MRKLQMNLYFFVILIAVIIQGCVKLPSDVLMPQWDTDLNIPIATKSYTIDDIIKKANSSSYITKDTTDNIYLIKSDTYSQSIGISNFTKVSTANSLKNTPISANGSDSVELFLAFPENATLDSATFVSGSLKVIGRNPSPTATCTLTVRIPGIYKANGTQLVVKVPVDPNSTNTQLVDLTGAKYKEPASQSLPPALNKGQLDIQAKASGTGTGLVYFDTYVSDFVFSTVTGYLPPKKLGSQTTNFPLNIGDATKYRDKVFLKTATLTLQGKYKSPTANPFVVKIDTLIIQGVRNSGGATKNLSFNSMSVDSFRFDANGNFTQPFTESNSNISEFITFLPDVIKIYAAYSMNPDNSLSSHTATSTDTVYFTTNFTSKSLLAILKNSFSDTLALDMDQNARDQIKKGQGVSATVQIQNAIALNSWVKVTLTDEHYNKLFVITKSTTGADSISFHGASVDANGNVTTPGFDTTTIALDSTQIKLLAERAHFAIISCTVATTGANNAAVYVRPTDWIKLYVYGHVSYRVKGDK